MSILTCYFLAIIPYAASITFNFTYITPTNSDIILSGDAAYIDNDEGIQVTYRKINRSIEGLAGRATYFRSLHLWNKDTDDLASFSTSFTFVIASYIPSVYGQGLTFFLAQNNSVMHAGGSIGLPFNYKTNTSEYPFVAVEFDTYGSNEWDPKAPEKDIIIGDHVGININSLTSVATRTWIADTINKKEYTALINYNSDSKVLSVSYTSFEENLVGLKTGLDYKVDLSKVLPEHVIFGFSASTGDRYEDNIVRSWMFNSTEFKGEKNTMFKVVGLTSGSVVLFTVLVILMFLFWRRKKNKGKKEDELGLVLEMNSEFELGASIPRRFSYLELASSTNRFAETEKLGEGGFGGVYKGFLKDLSMNVAIKKVSKTSNQGINEYASEVRIISQLRHKNLVQLIGWCHDKGELLLAYEFLENGSLDLHLFKRKSLLPWNTRYKIALGLASALLYLHEEWEQCVLHRDIKSSNVMLDSNFNPKLGDFGLAKLVDHEKCTETTRVAGTVGYMAPEYVSTGKASKESDVFSFGVVTLEIACGRRPIDPHAAERRTKLVEWVWDLYGTGTLLEAADPCLGSNFAQEEMTCLMIVGLWCAHPDSKLRPSMKQAIQVLNSEVSLPVLPSNMPYVTCSGLPHFSLYGNSLSSGSNKSFSKLSEPSMPTS